MQIPWLDGYSGETVDQLIALEGKYRIDSLVLAFEQALGQKAARVGYENLTEEERIILAIEALERAVNNDGYTGFFINSSRVYSPIIVEALHRVGCPKVADITQKALDIVKQTPMTKEDGTWEDNKERDKRLYECDELYYKGPENIEGSLFAFIKANKGRIQT